MAMFRDLENRLLPLWAVAMSTIDILAMGDVAKSTFLTLQCVYDFVLPQISLASTRQRFPLQKVLYCMMKVRVTKHTVQHFGKSKSLASTRQRFPLQKSRWRLHASDFDSPTLEALPSINLRMSILAQSGRGFTRPILGPKKLELTPEKPK